MSSRGIWGGLARVEAVPDLAYAQIIVNLAGDILTNAAAAALHSRPHVSGASWRGHHGGEIGGVPVHINDGYLHTRGDIDR